MRYTKYILILFVGILSSTAFAQKDKRNFDKDKYESARVAFITNRLDLKSDQAEKFWPMFKKYNEDKERIMRSMSSINKEADGDLTEEKAVELISKRFVIQKEMLDLDKAFMDKITSVLTHIQAYKLGGVNRDFAKQIYRMHQRRDQSSNN